MEPHVFTSLNCTPTCQLFNGTYPSKFNRILSSRHNFKNMDDVHHSKCTDQIFIPSCEGHYLIH